MERLRVRKAEELERLSHKERNRTSEEALLRHLLEQQHKEQKQKEKEKQRQREDERSRIEQQERDRKRERDRELAHLRALYKQQVQKEDLTTRQGKEAAWNEANHALAQKTTTTTTTEEELRASLAERLHIPSFSSSSSPPPPSIASRSPLRPSATRATTPRRLWTTTSGLSSPTLGNDHVYLARDFFARERDGDGESGYGSG